MAVLQGEFGLIRRLTQGRQPVSFQRACGVTVGIGDDAAVADVTAGMQLVLSCDTMVEQIHFSAVTMRDSDIGYKAMAAAISDIAAMGAVPRLAMVAISAPADTPEQRLADLYDGLYACAGKHSVAIAGGDTTSSLSGLTVTVSVTGEVEHGKALLRSGAQVGDVLFVTGKLGDSAAGLELLQDRGRPAAEWAAAPEPPQTERLIKAHCRPEPQVAAGRLLQRLGVCHALNDVSDGIASEAWELVEASGVGIDLIEDRIPLSDELYAYASGRRKDALDYALFGGEDYQLIGTMAASVMIDTQLEARKCGIDIHIIGYVNGTHREVKLATGSGTVVSVPKRGYNHFGKE
jgi:thiamine-monophosphate kinase